MDLCTDFQQFNQLDTTKFVAWSTIHNERTIFVKSLTVCLENILSMGST